MRIGICINMLGSERDPMGLEWLEAADSYGFEYVELPAAQMMDLDDKSFDALLERLAKLRMKCECCNNLFPAAVRLTGDSVSVSAVEEYLDRVFPRVALLGADTAVFGSSGAKNVPEGFSHEAAFRQIVDALRMVADRCREHGVRIAIEPLNRLESNIILNVADGARLMRAVARPEVRLLVDYYHHAMENETEAVIVSEGSNVIHTHFAEPEGRVMPVEPKDGYFAFFNALREAGYDGRISLEAFSKNPAEDMKRGLQAMRASLI